MKSWRKTAEYRKWRAIVIRRDKRCVACNSIKERQAHHINDATHHPDLRFDIDNGITMCKQCHTQFHTNFKKSFRAKCTKYDFDNFMALIKYFKEKFLNGKLN